MRNNRNLSKSHLLIVTAFALAFSFCTKAQAEGFYHKSREGWYFYNDPVENEEPEKEPTRVVSIPEPEKPSPQEKPTRKSRKEPDKVTFSIPAPPKHDEDSKPLTASAIKAMLPVYLEEAIDTPSEANVMRYYLLQKIAMDKATEFAAVQQKVISGNPLLDENTRRPLSPFLSKEMNREAGKQRDSLITSLKSRNVALWFMYDPAKEATFKQAPVVKALIDKLGMSIYPVSTKDIPLPDGLFPDYKVSTDHMKTLGVRTLPAFYLVQLPNTFIPIGEGGLSFTQLKDRILFGAVRSGIVSEDEFEKTRPVDNINTLSTAELDDLTVGMTKDAEQFLSLIKTKIGLKHD